MSFVTHKVWTAEELSTMSPAEQDAIFGQSIVEDVTSLPAEFLDRVRRRAQERIAEQDRPRQ